MRASGWLGRVAPGILVAATGVGAGDLATAAFTGGQLGLTVLWAVIVGACFKFVLNEGLARWQLATGTTVLEGAWTWGRPAMQLLFLPYLVFWSFFTGSALVSACGVAGHALFPVFDDAADGKVFFGVAHGLLGLALVWAGGFKLFERVMGVCIATMFVTVVWTAIVLGPGLGEFAQGLIPSEATLLGDGLTWTIALLGGVGGTLTILCYGYWIREKGRLGPADLPACRLDLGLGYAMTAVFGLAMVVIGSEVVVPGKGATLVVDIADRLEEPLGPVGRWAFLLGAWGAVFSSLLGVWQSVPYVYADCWRMQVRSRDSVDERGRVYRVSLIALAVVPLLGLAVPFKQIQKSYAIVGALFIPLLAAALLSLLRRPEMGALRLRWAGGLGLAAVLAFFAFAAYRFAFAAYRSL